MGILTNAIIERKKAIMTDEHNEQEIEIPKNAASTDDSPMNGTDEYDDSDYDQFEKQTEIYQKLDSQIEDDEDENSEEDSLNSQNESLQEEDEDRGDSNLNQSDSDQYLQDSNEDSFKLEATEATESNENQQAVPLATKKKATKKKATKKKATKK